MMFPSPSFWPLSCRSKVSVHPGVYRTEIDCWMAVGTFIVTLNVDLFGRSFGTRRNQVAVDAVVACPSSKLTVAWAPAYGTHTTATEAAAMNGMSFFTSIPFDW